ncbi:hypothetical protein [Flavobacterium sp.]|uniref:hypothetical protein n=1 Tax=Flavobacterium sp. TaxID=239 RepID=UPI00374D7D4C
MEQTTLFKNEVIEIIFTSTDAKGILVNATAINRIDGKEYTRTAGWISKTWYLHSFSKNQQYIFDAASENYHENIFKVAEAVLKFYKKLHNDYIEYWLKDLRPTELENNAKLGYDANKVAEFNGRIEPVYGKADICRYQYKMLVENLELIKKEREGKTFTKIPTQNIENNKIKVSR